MIDQTPNFIVLTGGPGVGKTTLLKGLQKQGFKTVAEDARNIIKQQLEADGDGLPWKNKQHYATLMLLASNASYRRQLGQIQGPQQYVFFDRGIPDALTYLTMEDLVVDDQLLQEAKSNRYNNTVFILPPWQEIYENDHERRQTWAEAEATFQAIKTTYEQLEYTVVEIPRTTVEKRCQYIRKKLGLDAD